jgi:hypothetical protein
MQLVSQWIASVCMFSGMLTIFISTLYEAYITDKPSYSSSRCTSVTEVPNGTTSHKHYTTHLDFTPSNYNHIYQTGHHFRSLLPATTLYSTLIANGKTVKLSLCLINSALCHEDI